MDYLVAFNVRELDDKAIWTRIGNAFPHKSGGGATLVLSTRPSPSVHGMYKIVILPGRVCDGDMQPTKPADA